MTALAKVDFERRSSPAGLALAEADTDGCRAAARQIAGGVCLVAHAAQGTRVGMTAIAVAPLSLDPPTLIVCVDRAAAAYRGLTKGAAFGVSALGADHLEFAEGFASGAGETGADRFDDVRWLTAPSGAPLLRDALAGFDCEVEHVVERGGQAVVFGCVRRAAVGATAGALIRWRGRYEQLGWTLDELARATGRSPAGAAR